MIQFAPEEYLFRAGETASEMFFVVSGAVDELSENSEVRRPSLRFKHFGKYELS